jgi:hypothetical protein
MRTATLTPQNGDTHPSLLHNYETQSVETKRPRATEDELTAEQLSPFAKKLLRAMLEVKEMDAGKKPERTLDEFLKEVHGE